jgi:hypothetical protein
MNKPNRITNNKAAETAILEYIKRGITDPIKIAELLNQRGCICAAVFVELFLIKRGIAYGSSN